MKEWIQKTKLIGHYKLIFCQKKKKRKAVFCSCRFMSLCCKETATGILPNKYCSHYSSSAYMQLEENSSHVQ